MDSQSAVSVATGKMSGNGSPREGRLWSWLGMSNERRFSALLTGPAQYMLFFIIVFPLLTVVYISLTSWSPTTGGGTFWWDAYKFWDWGRNYSEVFTSPEFWRAVGRTFLVVGVAVPLEFLIGLGLAFLFLEEFPAKRIFHSIILTPMMIVPAVAGYMFFMIFQTLGPINAFFTAVIGSRVEIRWLTDPTLANLAIVAAEVWQWTPLMFLILLSGLVGMPEDQMRAATILGATFWQKFRYLMLPMLKPVIIIALVIRFMEAFKIFDAVMLMTQGGPARTTETISIFMYREGFQNIRWSYTAAAAMVILVLVTIIASYALKPIQSPSAEQR
jgi:multiple sugar transport system permease protein